MENKIIIQSESDDKTTDDVLSWLIHLDSKLSNRIILFFDEYLIDKLYIEINSKKSSLIINEVNISFTDNFWYRRGIFRFKKMNLEDNSILRLEENLTNHNINPLFNFINHFEHSISINKFDDNELLKLKQFEECVKIKINFPDTYILDNKADLLNIIKINKKLISKGIKFPSMLCELTKNISLSCFSMSRIITINDLENLPNKFLPSLFQKYIEKQFEIRSFYLNGKFYSMAIFSQQNEKTKIDFRNYDESRPNRNIPYQLPKQLEKKLDKLMKKLNINCGSFDIIYTPEGKYYFLEVNPIGQFQWLSYNCNFQLEKTIANEMLM